jgi:hypothetical protein
MNTKSKYTLIILFIVILFSTLFITLTRVEKFLDKISGAYSLGNIIVLWYYNAYVSEETYNKTPRDFNYVTATQLVEGLDDRTFGKYITTTTPYPQLPSVPDIFLSKSNLWWWDSYDNIKAVYPYFTDALRFAIASFNDWEFTDTIQEDTCVIHMRLGDFLSVSSQPVKISDMIAALDRLPKNPKKFEILNGGKFHFTNEDSLKKTNEILDSLEKGIHNKFPDAEIVQIDSENADKDFYRAVKAPMLVTSTGSFAIMAAVANKNFRLTPALKILDQTANTSHIIPSENIYEDWYTYDISS